MIISFPVVEDKGLNSEVYAHFGSAPHFVFVDLDTNSVEAFDNPDKEHEHGTCNPIAALGDRKVDGVVVGGIGAGALKKLNEDGITVYRAVKGTVKDNAQLVKAGHLPVFDPSQVCGHHHGIQIGGCVHSD